MTNDAESFDLSTGRSEESPSAETAPSRLGAQHSHKPGHSLRVENRTEWYKLLRVSPPPTLPLLHDFIFHEQTHPPF